ncbi:ATP-binding protein [Mobilitalea sibirica]|uniref:ATP-binding protein n=1 Tax=Mobilitalea sibirica TaxID=1462919 RepID=A0A8J7HAZ6_9FIRM|nr:ATP-binding protein [Mobilitalea sibirica]MBH1939427.1 ATP-binding protein [Mobilitalea sibirica]
MELVILSGKGGTGKTTVVAALSELSGGAVRIDCDVDAPNLYLYYQGDDIDQDSFYGGLKAIIDEGRCIGCGVCEQICRFDAIRLPMIDGFSCEGCGACVLVCPQHAIRLVDEKTADTFITKTDTGIISRARMEIGSDGSGKLVTFLRKNSKQFEPDNSLTLIDGSPGIGCTVISSITGADAALIVTEPTQSGLSDLKRILELTKHFDLLTMVCINKYDINEEMSKKIEDFVREADIPMAGKIPFDKTVMVALNQLRPITKFNESPANKAIVRMWDCITKHLSDECGYMHKYPSL